MKRLEQIKVGYLLQARDLHCFVTDERKDISIDCMQ